MRSLVWTLPFSLVLSTAHGDFDWRYHARRLTGFSSRTQAASLQSLRKARDLKPQLAKALDGPDRALALDVISRFSYKDLLPDLFRVASRDESGAIHNSINALLDKDTKDQIVRQYVRSLEKAYREPMPTPALIAILDFLGRLRHPLPHSLLESFLRSTQPEVRSATLYYARLLTIGGARYARVFQRCLNDPSATVREQARAAVSELGPDRTSSGWGEMLLHWMWQIVRTPPAPAQPPREWVDPLPQDRKDCSRSYSKFFSEPITEIRIAFGYKDTRPTRFVGDRYEAVALRTYLTSPCVPGWYACGFRRSASNPDVLEKRVPDIGRGKSVRIILVHSSAGPDDEENRKDPFQTWLSQHAEWVFLEGLSTARAVFYNGHSRDGGGPDFAPPRLAPDGHVDYDRYARERVGTRALLDRIDASSPTRILGLFSCESTGHFLELVRENKASLATITSPKLIYYTDALKNLLGAVSALLGRACEPDFARAIHTRAEVGNSKLVGFFQNGR